MGHASAVQKRRRQKEGGGDTGAFKDRRNNIMNLTEPVIERDVYTGTGKRPRSIQSIDNVTQCYRLKVAREKLQVRLKLRDGSEPVEIAYMRHIFIADHVIERDHKRDA
jgi:hypothetical protein